MWNLKYGTNEPIYKTGTDSQRNQTSGCQREEGGQVQGWTMNSALVDANY